MNYKKSYYYIERASGYGQYKVVKVTPLGKKTRAHTTDSEAWDAEQEGKCSQARLKRVYEWFNQTK